MLIGGLILDNNSHLKVEGAGRKRDNISYTNSRVTGIFGDIWDSISMINFRYHSHPDGQNFTRENLEYILNGGEPVSLMTELVDPLISDSIFKPTPNETHLSLLHAKDIGCNNPNADVSAKKLNENSECDLCVKIIKTQAIKRIFNPFSCWRRGHLSGKVDIGFALNLSLVYDSINDFWFFEETMALHLTSTMLTNISQRNVIPGLTQIPNPERQMLASVTIRSTNGKWNSNTQLSELEQLPEQQLILSKSISQRIGDNSKLKLKEMPSVLIGALKHIVMAWNKKSHSVDTLSEHLDLVIIHHDGESIVEEIKVKLQKFNNNKKVESRNIISVGFDKRFFGDVCLPRNHLKKGDVLVVICLDPIIDLGVKPYGLK